uniref:Putative m13 family peptidase n=1 Tax=Rhipicephalus microplus TaxID=6941 RepID=A0A6G4ZVJ7_RHIMP
MLYSVSLNKWIQEMKKLRRPYDRNAEWLEGAAVVNAFYNPSANEMVFPAGILQGIFYEYGVPRSLNFGAIGMVVGHEMTHGFDDTGSQFDADGALKQWWSNKTREEFMNRTKCFEYQYGNITDKETNMTLNGKNTVGENIADNGGLRLSFEAYKNLLEVEYGNVDTRLKGMENVTGKQLFFLSNGMTWCSLTRPEYLKVLIQYDPHSPGRYRVNLPMSNMKAFSETFNCTANSTMNPTHRCHLW